ncbi:MAG: GNAT family N-acetyltransferase [Bacteroidetes bacterium]|nr:GNAT family N-acetyltransferase [Bacteroidota bacterium]
MSAKEKYEIFCTTHEVPLFYQVPWLDTCRLTWDVLFAEKDNVQAFWIYHLEHKMGFTFIRNPHLVPYTGLLFSDKRISLEQKQYLVNELMIQFPTSDVLSLDFSIDIPIELSFNRIIVSNKITNIISLDDKVQVYNGFQPALQRQIRKAEKHLQVFESDDLKLFYALHQKTFEKQNREAEIPFESYQAYWHTCKTLHCGKLFFIKDEEQNIHASLWMVWDTKTAYYLAGGTDHYFYGSGAMSKLMWHAIETAYEKKLNYFDFEGSMLPSVNTFFRKFGPQEKKYIHLEKVNSPLYKIYKRLR